MRLITSITVFSFLLISLVLTGCTAGPRYGTKARYDVKQHAEVTIPEVGMVFEGTASFYGKEFGGRKTANGEIFDPNGISAAHRNFPFGTMLEVTSKETGKSVMVKINDRGPFTDCIIDLSFGAAKKIGMVHNIPVRIRVVSVGTVENNSH